MKKIAPGKTEAKKRLLPRIGGFFAGIWRRLVDSAMNHLNDDDVFRRMGAAAIWVFLFFLAGYLISLVLLKDEFFSQTWLVQRFFGLGAPKSLWPPAAEGAKEPALLYWQRTFFIAGRIFLHYLVLMVLFILGLNHFRVGRVNLGLVFLFSMALLTGAVTGTRSFNVLYYSSTRLTALITFIRFNLWQLLSFMLAAVATSGMAVYATDGWLQGTWRKVRSWAKPKFKGEDLEVVVYSLLILIASCIAEARLVSFYDKFR